MSRALYQYPKDDYWVICDITEETMSASAGNKWLLSVLEEQEDKYFRQQNEKFWEEEKVYKIPGEFLE